MKRPQWTKRKMPVSRSGYVLCRECHWMRFLARTSTARCKRHR